MLVSSREHIRAGAAVSCVERQCGRGSERGTHNPEQALI